MQAETSTALDEIGLDTVQNGQIAKEKFFFPLWTALCSHTGIDLARLT